ncbi:MAG: ATP-binding protein [Deltaproteobacteria bacterium]|nr:MAG: ATP-binding protein [Deltaproteobacteria bacterium]
MAQNIRCPSFQILPGLPCFCRILNVAGWEYGLSATTDQPQPVGSCSSPGLVGGGRWPKPGEISLAHRGVLFLDELPEFSSNMLEMLRQPLEDKVISISRSTGSLTYPANFTLIAAVNPCPGGYPGPGHSSLPVQSYSAWIANP